MKHVLLTLFVSLAGLTLAVNDADAARRFGGGTSSGMQRSQPIKREAAPTQQTAPTQAAQTPATPAPSGASRWLAPLAGLAAGIGLASLFSHLGMGETFSSIVMLLLIGAAVFFIFRLLTQRAPQRSRPVQYAGGPVAEPVFDETPATAAPSNPMPRDLSAGPRDFDPQNFLHHAKLNFLRLQAANDARDIEDIRAFTTPEMFAVIKLQMQERGDTPQKTDVVTLNAELLELTTEFRHHIASVRFSGTIRESENSEPEAFDEIWHINKPTDDSRNWAIAGIQQAS